MASVQEVVGVLENAGFVRLSRPLTVVGAAFDFEAAVSGTNTSHDLVLISTGEVPAKRLQRLVAGLARSLDLAASRRPVSLVLIGSVSNSDRQDLERYARVLSIASTTPNIAEIEEAVAVLLPLKLPNEDLAHAGDATNEVLTVLGPAKATSEHIALIKAAAGGVEAVREALQRYANEGAGWTEEAGDDDE